MSENSKPLNLMRLGIHAEQKYFSQRKELYDTLVLNGNTVEYFSKGTASLLIGPLKGVNYFIDPVTHTFGHNPSYLMNRKKTEVKKSISALAESYGLTSLDFLGRRALSPKDFSKIDFMKEFTKRVIEFQKTKLLNALEEDLKYIEQPDVTPFEPILYVAPYFYFNNFNFSEWLPINIAFFETAKALFPTYRLFSEIVIDRGILDNEDKLAQIGERYSSIDGCDGYLLWVSDFSEHEASKSQLVSFKNFINELSKTGKPIYNLYGGYYSILLYHFGLTGVCHGPGYGENRRVVPVGGGIPRPKFYLNPIHQRLLHTEVQEVINQGAWASIDEFHHEVCNGDICRIVLDGDLRNFYRFGIFEARQREDGSFYNVPLPETFEIMNFHYLEAKASEFSNVANFSKVELSNQLKEAEVKYQEFLPGSQIRHLDTWAKTLIE